MIVDMQLDCTVVVCETLLQVAQDVIHKRDEYSTSYRTKLKVTKMHPVQSIWYAAAYPAYPLNPPLRTKVHKQSTFLFSRLLLQQVFCCDVDTHGCFFHLTQATWRRIQSEGHADWWRVQGFLRHDGRSGLSACERCQKRSVHAKKSSCWGKLTI